MRTKNRRIYTILSREGTALKWRIPSIIIISHYGGVGGPVSDEFRKEVEIKCASNEDYFIIISAKGITLYDVDRILIKRVDHSSGEALVEDKAFIPAGE